MDEGSLPSWQLGQTRVLGPAPGRAAVRFSVEAEGSWFPQLKQNLLPGGFRVWQDRHWGWI